MKLETKSSLFLVLVTAIWGGTFVLAQQAIHFMSPQAFVFLRMLIATVCFFPLVYRRFRHTTKLLFWGGLFLAIINALTYIFQTEGLKTIPASKTAFITGFGVVLVPMLSPIFGLGKPKRIEIISALFCMIGLYILTGANLSHLRVGDFWALACAFSYSILVILLQIISKKTTETLLLSFYMIAFGFIAPALMSPQLQAHEFIHWQVWLALLYCSILATGVVTFLMIRYQQHISVSRAAIIYVLEPVFATLFAFLFFNESVSSATIIGGAIICFSIMLPSTRLNQT